MTFRHVVMFTWNDDVDPAHADAVGAALATLPGLIPEIAAYRHGPDAGVNEGNFDYVVVADFATRDDYLVYRDHPDHRAFIAAMITGRVAARAAVQYDIAD
ncbi:MAG: Dabb family protein [Ilumatobacteraceae bacterium]